MLLLPTAVGGGVSVTPYCRWFAFPSLLAGLKGHAGAGSLTHRRLTCTFYILLTVPVRWLL